MIREISTWFLERPVCRASRCLSASLGYLRYRPKKKRTLDSPKLDTKLSALLPYIYIQIHIKFQTNIYIYIYTHTLICCM